MQQKLRLLLGNFSDKFLSRWVVLFIDLVIVFIGTVLAYIIRSNFDFSFLRVGQIVVSSLLFVFVSGICFLFFRSYISIIRHTSMKDAVLVFKSVSVAVLIIAMIRWLEISFFEHKLIEIPLSVVVIYYLTVLFILVSFRIFVKYSYHIFHRDNSQLVNTLIVGAGELGLVAKNTLINGGSTNYRVVGLVDENTGKIGKTIEGTKIYHFDDITSVFIEKKNVSEIIFAIQNIKPERKRKFIDALIELNVTVKIVPAVEKWIDGELNVSQIKRIKIEDLLQREPIKLDNPEVKRFIEGRTVMITGAAGSIGSEIVRQLLFFSPSKLVMVDQAETPLFELRLDILKLLKDTAVELIFKVADVSNKTRMAYIFNKHRPQVVFHAAAYKHVPMMEDNPWEAVRVNVFGTKNVADLSIEFDVERFVMISTDKAVRPTNVMGASKKLAELYCQQCGNQMRYPITKFITTRFGNVLGSNGSVIKIFRDQIGAGGPVTVTHPEIIRYFMTIPEACQLVLEASVMGTGSDVFIFDMGEPVKIVDLAKKMILLAGLELEKEIDIVFTGLRPGEKLYEELLLSSENTLPTHHSKIMIAQVESMPENKMLRSLQRLEKSIRLTDNFMIVSELKRIIPDYVSNNSVFEKLDKKQAQPAIHN